MCSWPKKENHLAKSYEHALREALPLITETLNCSHDITDTRYLLAATAALKGHTKLANVLNLWIASYVKNARNVANVFILTSSRLQSSNNG